MIAKICCKPTDNSALADTDIPPILRRIYARRGIKSVDELQLGVDKLLNYQDLSDIDRATDILFQAIVNEDKLTVVGDFDTDGATGTALATMALRRLGAKSVGFVIPDRFSDGHGLSRSLIRKVLSEGSDVIVTVDGGISSHEGTILARESGMKVLITDHHLPGDTLPPADAIVNPNLQDCKFKSKHLSGVGVIFYLMLALRAHLIRRGWFRNEDRCPPRMVDLLDLVALGTVADMVPLDENNRVLIHQGLRLIRSGCCRVGIRELMRIANLREQVADSDDLSFSVVPRLNAAGRLSSMSVGVELLVTDDQEEARSLAFRLDLLNRRRQRMISKMEKQALIMGETSTSPGRDSRSALVMYHETWHQGMTGILASRMKDRFHLPVVIFAPAENGTVKGSGRSLSWLHLHRLIQEINDLNPGLVLEFGGHAMAVGLTLKKDDIERFSDIFGRILGRSKGRDMSEETIWTDGELAPEEISVDTARLIRDGGPWGVGFPSPTFSGSFMILHRKLTNRRHLKILLRMMGDSRIFRGVIFDRRHELFRLSDDGSPLKMVYQLNLKGSDRSEHLQLLIRHVDLTGNTSPPPVPRPS